MRPTLAISISLLSSALLTAALCTAIGCKSEAVPIQSSADAWDLGRDTFIPDADDDLAIEDVDAEELDAIDLATDRNSLVGAPCSLLDVGGCGDLKCSPTLDGGAICWPIVTDPVELGGACGGRGADDCDANLICADPAGELNSPDLKCYAVCDSSTTNACSDGQVCSDPLPWLTEPVGLCLDES